MWKEVLSSHHVEPSRPSLTTVSLRLRLPVQVSSDVRNTCHPLQVSMQKKIATGPSYSAKKKQRKACHNWRFSWNINI